MNRRRVAWQVRSNSPNSNCSSHRASSWPMRIACKGRKSPTERMPWRCKRSHRSMEIRLFTIGFTQKTACEFFTALKEAGVKRVVDVRLNNNSQLAGFSKKEDLSYFLKEI